MSADSGIDPKFKKRFDRERSARKAAERLIEEKSRELYFSSQSLQEAHQDLKEKSDHLNEVNLKLNEEIKERERTQQALAASVKEALELSRLKTEFLTNMSHEIRTPLNGIMGLTQLLFYTPLNSEQTDYLTEISKSSESLLSIAKDILDLSGLESENIELNNAPFDLTPLLNKLIAHFSQRALDKGLELNLNISPAIPKKLIGDAKLLSRSLQSLLGNGIKFTNTGKVDLSVVATTQTDESVQLNFAIRDTGVGILNSQFEHIFQSFSQADATLTRQHEGAGLGLTLSKNFIELMGGEIKLESAVGVGSVFHINIPFKIKKKPKKVDPAPLENKCSVLLVDDNKINQRVAASLFKRIGCHLVVANDGLEAIQLLRQNLTDVVFLDAHMPCMNGEETAKVICTEWNDTRPWIIAMLNMGDKIHPADYCSLSIDDVITKPMRLNAVTEALKRNKAIKKMPS